MNLSRNWLNEFVDLHDITDKQFNDEMTLSGSKVETIERLDESLKNVVAGKILSMEKHPDSLLFERTMGRPERMNAKTAIDCAREGDRAALEVFHNYVDHLGSAVASMINLLDCERVAIGGGVSAAGEFLFEPLRKNVHAKSFFENHGSVVPAVMGNDAGIIGAAMLRRNEE